MILDPVIANDASFKLLLAFSLKKRIPLMRAGRSAREGGRAPVLVGADYAKIGDQAWDIAKRILQGEIKPSDVGVRRPEATISAVNNTIARTLGLGDFPHAQDRHCLPSLAIPGQPSPRQAGMGLTWKLILHFLWILIALAATLTLCSLGRERALLLDEAARLRHTAQTNYWIQNNLVNLISPDPAALDELDQRSARLERCSLLRRVVQRHGQRARDDRGQEAASAMARPVDPQQLAQTSPFTTMNGSGGRFYDLALPIVLPQGSSGGPSAPGSPLTGLMPAAALPQSRPDILGAVRLGISAASVNAKMQAIRNDSIKLAAGIVALALALSYVLMRSSTRPIKEVARQATAIANGDFARTPEL